MFFYASGSSFDEMYVGVGAKRIRDLFGKTAVDTPETEIKCLYENEMIEN